MPSMKSRGGLFIEFTRTPSERKQAEAIQKVKSLEEENKELSERLNKLEELLGSMVKDAGETE